MATPMKEGLGPAAVQRIRLGLESVFPSFQGTAFKREALKGLDRLELKERVHHLIQVLHRHLPDAYPDAARGFSALPGVWDRGDPADPLRGFAAWPLIDYHAVYGLAHAPLALDTLRRLTPLFSAEFALRPFLLREEKLTLSRMTEWLDDPDEHVRRLVSEGCRPRLPWGMQLKPFIEDPTPVLELLEHLKDDPSLYVRRSVANNLNDISKDHPHRVLETCTAWMPKASTERLKLIHHALRSLVKSGEPAVFPLLGFTENPKIRVCAFDATPSGISLGDSITLNLELESRSPVTQHFVLDYVMDFAGAGGVFRSKVFKWTRLQLAPGESVSLRKKHPLRKVTTRRYYAGQQRVGILINGNALNRVCFKLHL